MTSIILVPGAATTTPGLGFAWLFTGNGAAPSAARSAAASSSMAALRAGDGLPPAAYGSAWAGDEPTLATPITATPTVTAQPNASQSANSASPCLMAYGAGAVRVVVTWHGRVVWDSTSCDLAAATTVQFRLGVPQVLTIRWNRQAAGPSGCAGSLSPGASGTFEAVALAAGQSSQVRAFRLLR